ncbi:MAG: peptidoglycan bridge formation glycyltransferase FemA/FemB family protein [Bacteroidetes bacterium]|nr:peptidoglycan bridge formation glycyltransferase FemA/FemB family protein [Bacteroidota bacterium]
MKIERLDFNSKEWQDFITQEEKSNIFSSPEMNQVFNLSDGVKSFPLFAIENNKIAAAVFPVLVKIKTPLPERFTNRIIIYSSPIYIKDKSGIDGLQILFNEIKKLAKKEAVFIEIRNSESFPIDENKSLMEGFSYIPYQNYLIDLKKGAEHIWNSLGTYTRNHIRRSEKNNITVREIHDDELDIVISLLGKLYQRKNIPFIDKSIFHYAYKILKPKNYIRVTVMDNRSQIIAARITLNFNRTVYDWYAASDPNFNNYYPNEALAWNAMKWGCDNHYEIFDFGGGAIRGQEYGPAKFKEKFHGELVEYGRYRFIINKPIYLLGSKLYNLRVSKK